MLTEKNARTEGIDKGIASFASNKRIYIQSIFCLIFMAFMANGVDAQINKVKSHSEREAIANVWIQKLKVGALVVRLKTEHKKIIELEKAVNNKDYKNSQRKRAEKAIKTTIRDRDRFNQEIVAAFHEHYDFSEFYFIYDTSSVQLKNGTERNIFLNKELEIDTSITLINKPYLILTEGSTDEKGVIVDGFIVTTSEGEFLHPPFPRYFKIESNLRGILTFLSGTTYVRKPGKEIVLKINKKFHDFVE